MFVKNFTLNKSIFGILFNSNDIYSNILSSFLSNCVVNVE